MRNFTATPKRAGSSDGPMIKQRSSTVSRTNTDPAVRVQEGAGTNDVPPHRPASSSLNPADAWPFTRSEPESDQQWRKDAPEALL